MSYQTVIRGFGAYVPSQAEALKAQLSLSMSAQMILYCATYYKNVEKRDPFVEEIKMLDLLSCSLEGDCHAIAPSQFYTNDEFVAKTYADLLTKRNEMNAGVTNPCSVAEAATLASRYLLRAAPQAANQMLPLLPENVRDRLFSDHSATVAPHGSTYRLRPFSNAFAQAVTSDVLILLKPDQNQTSAQFNRSVDRFLQNEALIPHLKSVQTVSSDGILRALLEITDGVRIHLSSMAELGIPLPMTALCNTYVGCRMLRVGLQRFSHVLQSAKTNGVRAVAFAQITGDQKFTFLREQAPAFSIDSRFMRKLYHCKPACAKLTDERTLSPSGIHYGCSHENGCSYLSLSSDQGTSDVVIQNGTLTAAACATPTQAFFKTALYTALLPVITMALNGVAPLDQNLSLAMELPTDCSDPYVFGSCMASVLGLYRAQMELGMPAHSVTLRTFDQVKAPTVTAFSTVRGEATPEHFTAKGGYVYCISPVLTEDGLPDFIALRQMLNQLVQWRKEGTLTAFRVLFDQSVTDGLQKMRGSYTCRLSDSALAAQGTYPVLILLESAKKLPLRQVGTVCPAVRKEKSTLEESIPTPTELIWSENVEITILAKKQDSDASALAATLEKRGACVTLFSDDAADADPLSRAILTSHYLIVCKNANLLRTSRIDFALDTLKRAGGAMISFSSLVGQKEDALLLKKGLTEEILNKMFGKSIKNTKKF